MLQTLRASSSNGYQLYNFVIFHMCFHNCISLLHNLVWPTINLQQWVSIITWGISSQLTQLFIPSFRARNFMYKITYHYITYLIVGKQLFQQFYG